MQGGIRPAMLRISIRSVKKADKSGVSLSGAPASGEDPATKAGTLAMMTGRDRNTFDKVFSLLS